MDATRPNLLLLLIVVLAGGLAGCGNNGTVNSTDSAECTSQAVSNSFLVKWKGQVPAEFAAYKISPDSLTTRFSETSQEYVEKEILKRHLNEYSVAEHEFNIQLKQDEMRTESILTGTTPPPAVWAPQDLQISSAWSALGKKGDGIIVAVIDSGVDVNHPLLQGQLWTNSREIPGNGIDDDQNGLVDDYMGYDFDQNAAEVTDGANHGTHVSGIIAGLADPTTGFTGMAPNAKIMPLKFINSQGQGSVTNAIRAMNYAINNGARVINASWGGSQCSDVLKQDIVTAVQSGIVFVAAAGNDGVNLSVASEWPAIYQIAGKITVGSYNDSQILSSFSNYGTLVDLAAPGEDILSTVPPASGQPEGQLAGKSGTSMATPFVTGVAAMLMSGRPSASALQIVNAINGGVIQGRFGVRTQGKLNALDAVQNLLNQ